MFLLRAYLFNQLKHVATTQAQEDLQGLAVLLDACVQVRKGVHQDRVVGFPRELVQDGADDCLDVVQVRGPLADCFEERLCLSEKA